MQVSIAILRARLREAGTGFRDRLTDGELAQAIRDSCQPEGHGRMAGCRIVQAGLSVHAGIRAPRDQVLRVQHALSPPAHAARQERVLHRGMYDTTEAMVTWHIDSEHPRPTRPFFDVSPLTSDYWAWLHHCSVLINVQRGLLFLGGRLLLVIHILVLMVQQQTCTCLIANKTCATALSKSNGQAE